MTFRSIAQTALAFAALTTLVACGDDDSSGPAPTAAKSSTRTATATQGAANTTTATRPPATFTSTATIPAAAATATPTVAEEATSTPTVAEATATATPQNFAGNYSATLPLAGGATGLLNFTVAADNTASGTLDTGSSAAAIILVTGSVDAQGNFTLTGEGVNLSGTLPTGGNPGTVSGTVEGTETSGTVEPSEEPTPTHTQEAESPTETPTETPTVASEGLGVREFTLKRPGTTFNTSALGGVDVSLDPWLPATLKLEGGIPDGSGVASIKLMEDVILGWTVIDNSVACMKLLAEGSSGTIACNGGVPQGVVMSADSNVDGPPGPITVQTGQGDPSPAGSLYFTLTRSVTVNLPAGSSVQSCLTVEFSATEPGVFTSANGKAVLLNPVQGGAELTLDKTGEPFDCSNWTNADGPGQLSGPVLGFDQAIGDVANILFLSGHTTE